MEFDARFWEDSDDPDVKREIHLLEAATATSFQAGHQIEIQLGHYCNNRCVFCVSGQLTEEGLARPIDASPVLEALEAAAAKGIRKVTFLGGEPTIQRSFHTSLTRAIALGFNDIVIFTNGARGANHQWMADICALGDFTWRFSLQGANEQAHEAATKRKRSWRRIISAIAYLAERDADLTANMCLSSQALTSLPDFPALLATHKIRQLHIDMVRPNNAGHRDDAYLMSIMPRHAESRPYIEEMLRGLEAVDPDFDVSIGNYPYCLLPEWANKIQHGGEPTLTLTTGHKGELDRLMNKYDYQRVDAVYAQGCDDCIFRLQCRGVPRKYAEYYGTDELVPVTASALRTRDHAQRAFAVTMQAALSPLLEGPPPPGFVEVSLTSDLRERRAVLSVRDEAGHTVAAVFSPTTHPGPSRAPLVLVAEAFTVGLEVGGVAGADLKALLVWLQTYLASVPWVGTVRRVATASARARAEARLRQIVTEFRAPRRLGGWLSRGAAVDADAAAVTLGFGGPGDARLDVDLALQADGRLTAAFRLGEGTSADIAKPAVQAIRRLLRAG